MPGAPFGLRREMGEQGHRTVVRDAVGSGAAGGELMNEEESKSCADAASVPCADSDAPTSIKPEFESLASAAPSKVKIC